MTWTLQDLTPEQIESLQMHFVELRDRVDERRQHIGVGTPIGWTVHFFEAWSSNSAVLIAVDDHTSGKWGFNEKDNVIAFEDPADLTMFLLGYQPPEPIYRS